MIRLYAIAKTAREVYDEDNDAATHTFTSRVLVLDFIDLQHARDAVEDASVTHGEDGGSFSVLAVTNEYNVILPASLLDIAPSIKPPIVCPDCNEVICGDCGGCDCEFKSPAVNGVIIKPCRCVTKTTKS